MLTRDSLLPRTILLAVLVAGSAGAQGLYSHDGLRLNVNHRMTGANIFFVGTMSGNVTDAKGLAVDPTTGTAYLEYRDVNSNWRLGTVDLSTAVVTDVGDHDERFRSLAFDSTGKLWGVSGALEANPNALLSIDPGTGATTLENGSLPTARNKLAYDPTSDTIFMLGLSGGSWQLHSFSSASPGSLTQIPLTGVDLNTSSMNLGGMEFEPNVAALVTQHRTATVFDDFVTITTSGVATAAGMSIGEELDGLAFVAAIFADGFESGDTSAW